MKSMRAAMGQAFAEIGGRKGPSGKKCEFCGRPWNFYGNDGLGFGLEIDPAGLSLTSPCCKARREVLHVCADFNKRQAGNLETVKAFKAFLIRGSREFGRTFFDLTAQAVRDGVGWEEVRKFRQSFLAAQKEATG